MVGAGVGVAVGRAVAEGEGELLGLTVAEGEGLGEPAAVSNGEVKIKSATARPEESKVIIWRPEIVLTVLPPNWISGTLARDFKVCLSLTNPIIKGIAKTKIPKIKRLIRFFLFPVSLFISSISFLKANFDTYNFLIAQMGQTCNRVPCNIPNHLDYKSVLNFYNLE